MTIKIEAAHRISSSDTEVIQLQNRLKALRKLKHKGPVAEKNFQKQVQDLKDQIKNAKKKLT